MVVSLDHSSQDVFKAHLLLLESLLPSGWFSTRHPRHPAFHRWSLLKDYVENNAVPQATDGDGLCLLAELLLDGFHVMAACGGKISDLHIGKLANYGDAAVQQRIRAVTPDATDFLAVMTELSRAAFHIGLGHSVRAVEGTSLADLVVNIRGHEIPVIMDCKHVDERTSLTRFPKYVQDVNRQVKAHGTECYGVAILDVTNRARRFIEHKRSRPTFRQHVPGEVREAVRALLPALRRFNSSVGAALILWNEIRLLPEGPSHRLIVSKRTRLLSHREPKRRIPDDLISILEKDAGGVGLRIKWRRGA
jgi:hypothetical protein